MSDWSPSPAKAKLIERILEVGLHRMVDLTLRALGPEGAIVALTCPPAFHGPGGTMHGGACNAICEPAAMLALLPHVEDGQGAVTVDYFAQHLRPVPVDAALEIEAKVLRPGRTLAQVAVTFRANGRDCISARITKMISPL